MSKTFTLLLIAAATAGATYALVHFIKMDGFAFAWSLNFLLMIGVLAFTESMKSPLASTYYHAKEWEQKGKIYERIGINFYRKLLVGVGWEKLNKKSNPVERNTAALEHLHYQTRKSELGHAIILVIVLGFNVYVAVRFGVLKSLWLLVLNILLNLYPVLLQRYNRPRLERAIAISLTSPS
ncbi:glycosyl-4,4'-diaponeurosporenoate acyltransferase CrtO family protein [Chitinophaga rhizosphaerae]|uniref:glycosyl-4,4'-diaponeurosporenoate acyltransferase CrtO family protein n=1 Tax=Chitinophaga rhizosphaerae TaxID=1864947 RepID=UPI000F807318|nr:hypothetical protein [Chitinophaga rhizosphaerae]